MEHYEARRNECKLHKGTEEMLASCDQFCTQSVLSAYQQQGHQSKHRLDTLGISIFNDIGELEALFRKD